VNLNLKHLLPTIIRDLILRSKEISRKSLTKELRTLEAPPHKNLLAQDLLMEEHNNNITLEKRIST
jgi:hypothetical protein